jgi:Na+-transporting NADH:ubiquinone oxidoreductase subunit B
MRRILDRLHPLFAKGGRLEKLYPLYEAIDTFLYTPDEVTVSAPHVRDALDMKRMMSIVVVALVPCIFMALDNTGYQANLAISGSSEVQPLGTWREPVLQALGAGHDPDRFWDNLAYGALWFVPLYLVTMVVGGLWEVLFATVRRHEINEGFLVTGMLFPLTLPPTTPLWQAALGISFGVVIGKEIFGGTGKNFLNPALVARAFLYFAYPAQITGVTVWTAADGFSGATPLTAMKDASALGHSVVDIAGYGWWDAFWGYTPGSMGETSAFCCLLGAAVLIATGIGSWRIMTAVVGGAIGTSLLFWLLRNGSTNPMMFMPPWWHLVVGGFAFGTVFMATDPVSAAATETGQWWYGGLIGVVTILIRVINPAYPEGIMLAILFGNVMAPLVDYFVIQANIKRRLARYGS